MPGVPSSRACEACRKQKKKCDLSKPSCSRCTRLQIPCIGCGQRRYKFSDQKFVSRPTKDQAVIGPVSTVNRGLTRPPSNQATMVASAFVSALETTDLRYKLTCYGGFLKGVPRRLGTNDALDASVGALTSAFSSLSTCQQSPVALGRYVHALKTLRVSLNDPAKARTPSTLCAMYLIMVCQGWIGRHDDQYTSHGEVMAYLLNTTAVQDWRGSFESQLLVTLCVPVIVESIANPKIQLGPWFQKLAETYQPPRPFKCDQGIPIHSIGFHSLAKIPNLVREPELHLLEIQSAYQQIRDDAPKLRQRLVQLTELTLSGATPPLSLPVPVMEIVSSYRVAYGILLALASTFNGILRAFEPDDMDLVEESTGFSTDIITLAAQASQHRPLGASYIPACLVAAWAATVDPSKQAEVEKMIAEYQTDFVEAGWMQSAIWLRNRFESLRRKLAISHPKNPLDNASTVASAPSEELAEAIEPGTSCHFL